MKQTIALLLAFLLVSLPVFAATNGLTVSFITASPGGQYSPKNVLAVWITTTNGSFERTIGRWAASELSYLTSWRTAAGSSDTDAIMGATRPNHVPVLTNTWNMMNRAATVVPNDTYRINFECADGNHQTYNGVFVKGATPSTNTLAGNAYFKNITIAYVPVEVQAQGSTQDTLTVVSAHGGAWPSTLATNFGATINAYVTNSPVIDGSTQYVCTSAQVISNFFTQVNATNVSLLLTNNAMLIWQWQTNYWGVPQSWFEKYGWSNNFATVATNDPDQDGFTVWQEYIADVNPTNPADFFHITAISNLPPWKIYFSSSSTGRLYSISWTTNLASGAWTIGTSNVYGHGGNDVLSGTNIAPQAQFFKLSVQLP